MSVIPTIKSLPLLLAQLNAALAGAVTAAEHGVKGDGSTDDTKALQAFAAAPGKVKVLPPGTYIWDGTPLDFGDGFTLIAWGATLKLKAGSYSTNLYAVRNRGDINYSAGTARHKNIRIFGLTIDGNYANVTNSASTSGFHFHQADNVILFGTKCVDLPGTFGGLDGVIFRFCNDCHVLSHESSNTDRQAIAFWESTGSIRDCNLGMSRFREPILVSGENVKIYQASWCLIEGSRLYNVGTTSGTHVLRFSGESSGVVRSNRLYGSSTLDGIYVTFGSPHSITIEDNDVEGCKYGLNIDTDGYKEIRSINNRYRNCTNGIRWNAAGSASIFESLNDKIIGTTTQPLYVSSCENVRIRGASVEGGATNCFLGNHITLDFTGNTIAGMSSASYSVNIGAAASGTALATVSLNRLYGNTANVITTTPDLIAQGNDLSNMTGDGLKLSRFGRDYLWTSNAGVLYIKTSRPSTDTDGTVVGTQT